MHYQRVMRHGSTNKPARPRTDPAQRFWAKVDKTPGCWLWTGMTDRNGYGYFNPMDGRHNQLAHRWSYETALGPIPPELTIDHLCRQRNCVRPSHLEAVTFVENIRRGTSISATTVRTGICQRGHAMTPENIYVTPSDGHRSCRVCRKAAATRGTIKAAAKRRAARQA
jgi:hypothetical protein